MFLTWWNKETSKDFHTDWMYSRDFLELHHQIHSQQACLDRYASQENVDL